jgi:hypothetical protein
MSEVLTDIVNMQKDCVDMVEDFGRPILRKTNHRDIPYCRHLELEAAEEIAKVHEKGGCGYMDAGCPVTVKNTKKPLLGNIQHPFCTYGVNTEQQHQEQQNP